MSDRPPEPSRVFPEDRAETRTRTVLALGGNALTGESDTSHEEQLATARETVSHLDERHVLARDIVWTHGNGPQVGNRLLEQEATETPSLPLDALVAETQGHLGYLLTRALDAAHDETALTVATRAVVDPDDPAFESPTKPVGPWYAEAEAASKSFETAEVGAESPSYRRVVASPRPQRVVEGEQIERLVERGESVVCCGGGGIPVAETDGGFEGEAAVVDKDYTSALLGERIEAEELVFLTDVPYAYLDYGTDDQRPLESVDPSTLRDHLQNDEFGEGSMRPKVEACISFVEAGGDRAVITETEQVAAALAGDAGTQVE